MDSKSMIIRPKMSEKSYALSKLGVYVFDVPVSANKNTVAAAVAAQFDVKVIEVNLLNHQGKAKRTIRNNGRKLHKGVEPDKKRAYVLLAKGQSLPIFQAVEEEIAQEEKTQATLAKQAEKAEKKPRKHLRRKAEE
ncbi:MAG TPA: 50S ribosomal protein L23 [Patescibacteria group bacterium]|jgi:large subunit ribosomal protein L23|nr:50S ribosomal protein L23 [Patescibacteria group bacterium]